MERQDSSPGARPAKTPTANRKPTPAVMALGVALLCGALPTARAQRTLTEADVARLARDRAPDGRVAAARAALADARERTAGLLPNPKVGWGRETLGGSNVQDVLRLTVPLQLAGPLTTRALAASRSAWIRAQASARRTQAVLEALLRFYDVAVARRRVTILERAEAQLEEGARVLARREAAGTASGYESTRLAIDRELARSRTAQARGALASARARLAGWLGLDAHTLRVDPELPLAPMPPVRELAHQGATQRETAEHARASAQSAEQAADRARWTWAPTLWATGGLNTVQNPNARHGYILGLALSIPLFDRGQDQQAEARAQGALASARARALERAIRTDIAAQHAAYRAARDELERFEAATSDEVENLRRAARAGYRAGERTLVELLDAQRARTRVALRRLELRAAAKRAEARVRAAAGRLP